MKRYLNAICICCTGLLLCACGDRTPDSQPAFAEQTTVSTAAPVTETHPPAETLPALTADEIAALPAETMLLPEQLASVEPESLFTAEPISDAVFDRINGISYQENPYISRDDLRYLRVLHYNPAGDICTGELICNQAIAADLTEIFRTLYDAQYPIARMVLIDAYNGDDEASMADNNTSCFNYRVIAGSTTLSNHAKGLALDINPRNNPYITFNADGSENVAPANAQAYADREAFFPMKIDADDLCYQLFTSHGFTWGGSWDTPKDYQHFEKP